MESLGRQLALLLFTDGFTMPAPAVEFVRKLCDSESASLLSTFAVATLTLGVCLHSRETIESAKQLLDTVDSLGDRLSTMMGDGEEESGKHVGSSTVLNSVLRADELRVERNPEDIRVGINNDAMMVVWSSDKANFALREEKVPEAASHPGSIDQKFSAAGKKVVHATRDPQSPAQAEPYGSKQAVNSTLTDRSTQLPGDMESPTGTLGTLDCSEAPSGLDIAIVLPLVSSSHPSMSEKLRASCNDATIANPITFTPNDTRPQADDESAIADSTQTIGSSHSLLIFQGTECTPGKDDRLVDVGAFDSAIRIATDSQTGQRVIDDFEENHLELSSSSSMASFVSENRGNACNELASTHMADQCTESDPKADYRDALLESPAHLNYSAAATVTEEDDTAIYTAPSALIDIEVGSPLGATKQTERSCGTTREARKTSVAPWNFASPPASIKIAENMRRRAFELMEESHKLRESSLCVIFEHRNPNYDVRSVSGLAKLDLHSLTVQEAILITRLHLEFCRKIGAIRTEIITGRGRHSKGGEAILRPVVFKELAQHLDVYICETDPNPGRFILTLARENAVKADG